MYCSKGEGFVYCSREKDLCIVPESSIVMYPFYLKDSFSVFFKFSTA